MRHAVCTVEQRRGPVVKWFVVLAALIAFAVIGVIARGQPKLRSYLALGLGLFPFFDITLNPVSFEWYRGDARGFEFALVDFFSVAVLLSLPPGKARTPYRFAFGAFLLAAALSIASAGEPMFAFFAVWKVARGFLLIAAVAKVCILAKEMPRVLQGLALGVVLTGAMALKQRYLDGYMSATGPFAHQNGMGMSVNMVYPCCYALMLAGRGGWLARLAVAFGAVAIVLTLSRGGMAIFALTSAVVYLGAVVRRFDKRTAGVLALSVAGAFAVLAKSYDTIVERFLTAPESSHEARELFEQAASAMLDDHPMGIGMNQYSRVLDASYADRFDIPPVDRDGIVHNVYWLNAAELGYLGAAAFFVLVALPLLSALRGALTDRRTLRGDLMVGFAAGIGAALMQSNLEWALRMTQVGNVFWVMVALTGALASGRLRLPAR